MCRKDIAYMYEITECARTEVLLFKNYTELTLHCS